MPSGNIAFLIWHLYILLKACSECGTKAPENSVLPAQRGGANGFHTRTADLGSNLYRKEYITFTYRTTQQHYGPRNGPRNGAVSVRGP